MFKVLRRKTIPAWIVLCLVVFTASITVAFALGVTSIQVTKPFTTNLTFSSTLLQVNSATFGGYSSATNQYATCTVGVQNFATSGSATPTVQIDLFDGSSNIVAQGSTAGGALATGGTANIVVNLTWTSGKTLNDVASGIIAVTQS